MGWSIDTARADLNLIFDEIARHYRITHPQSAAVGVLIEYDAPEGLELPLRFKIRIAGLFPEFVYIDFVKVDMNIGQFQWDNTLSGDKK